jgi:uncharacterized protein YbcI
MPSTQIADGPQHPRGSLNAAMSNLVVRLLSEYTGRGPTQARTYIQDDLISVVLRDSLTKGERSLVADGHTEHVLQTRKMYQETMRSALVSGIEELTGRRVIAFLSDNHIDPDIAVETLLLEPLSGDEPAEVDATRT